MQTDHDVVVVGGGVAGQSAALMLGRAHVNTGLIDDPGAAVYSGETHNMLTNDGRTKAEIVSDGAEDIGRYPSVASYRDRVDAVEKDAFGYLLTLAGGRQVSTSRIVFALGYRYPTGAMGIDGFDERFGTDVFTCPYCHGFEYTDRRIALIGSTATDGHFLRLLQNWSSTVSYLRHDGPGAEAEGFPELSGGVFLEERVARIEGAEGAPVAVLESGRRVESDVLFVADMPGDNTWPQIDALGIERGLHPVTGKAVYKTDAAGRTDLRDVFVIGDARTGFSSLTGAANEGMVAGFMLTNDIIEARSKAKGQTRMVV